MIAGGVLPCPSGQCLCRTLQQASTQVWSDLDDAQALKSPLHEDSITQYLALNLNRLHPDLIRVHSFNKITEEPKIGSDFLWLILSEDGKRCARLAIQAKRLYPNGKYSAFTAAQVGKIINFATRIKGKALYLTYNFGPLSNLNPSLWTEFRNRKLLSLVYLPRDGGLVLLEAKRLIKSGSPSLVMSDLANFGWPAWLPFCGCPNLNGSALGVLDRLSLLFPRGGSTDPLESELEIHEVGEALSNWIAGNEPDERTFLEIFEADQVGDDGFSPSFVIATNSGLPERRRISGE